MAIYSSDSVCRLVQKTSRYKCLADYCKLVHSIIHRYIGSCARCAYDSVSRKVMIVINRRWEKYAVVSVMTALSLVVPWIGLGLGAANNGDEGYMNLCIRDYQNSPLAMLTFYIGHLWTSLFGDSFLTIRRLGYAMGTLAILIGCTYYFQRTRKMLQAAFLFALGCAVMSLERFLIYNWDVGAYPYYALLAVLVIDDIRRPRIWKVIAAGFTMCMLAMSRIQLVILMPVFAVMVAMPVRRDLKMCAGHVLAYLLSVSVAFVLLTWVMCGSVSSYINAFSQDNIITGHGLKDMMRTYYIFKDKFAVNISAFSLSLSVIIVSVAMTICPTVFRVQKSILYGFIAFLGFSYYLVLLCIYSTVFNILTSFTGIVLFLLLLLPVCNLFKAKKERVPVLQLVVVWVLLAAPVLGSDYSICRMFSSFLLAPIMTILYPYSLRYAKLGRLLRNLMSVCCVAYGFAMVGRVYVSAEYACHPMDDFQLQKGIRSCWWDYKEWMKIREMTRSVEETGARLNYDGWRYAFAYSMQSAPVTNLHLYHVQNNEENIERRRKVVHLYDAWLMAYVEQQNVDGIRRMLEDEGFEIVRDGVYNSGDGVLLMMRQPFADRYRQKSGCGLPDSK